MNLHQLLFNYRGDIPPYIQIEYTVWSRGGYGVVTVW